MLAVRSGNLRASAARNCGTGRRARSLALRTVAAARSMASQISEVPRRSGSSASSPNASSNRSVLSARLRRPETSGGKYPGEPFASAPRRADRGTTRVRLGQRSHSMSPFALRLRIELPERASFESSAAGVSVGTKTTVTRRSVSRSPSRNKTRASTRTRSHPGPRKRPDPPPPTVVRVPSPGLRGDHAMRLVCRRVSFARTLCLRRRTAPGAAQVSKPPLRASAIRVACRG
jgi:hypothetical protein